MKPILLDIMLNGRFVCQLRYTRRGFPMVVGGVVTESYDNSDFRKFVEQQRPSLRNKDFKIELAEQKI